MDNAELFSVRTEAAERIRVAMEQHKLPKDDVGGYRYNHAVTLVENIEECSKTNTSRTRRTE